jgi:hypothetical protein
MAPMALETYEDTRPWARLIKQKVVSREMPPWSSNLAIGEYLNDPSLTESQIAKIVKWVDGSSPKGNPTAAPAPIVWPPSGAWRAGTPDLVLSTPSVRVPAVGPDSFPEFEVPTGLGEDRYIKSIEILPENDAVVHHVVVFNVESSEGLAINRDDNRGPGRTVLANRPYGGTPDQYEDGIARLLRKDGRVRFQLHLHPNGESFVEHTKIGFRFFPKGYVPKYLVTSRTIQSQSLTIPPMDPNFRSESRFTFERNATLINFQPHMHYRGKRMTLEAILPSGEIRLLSDIDRFTQAWQHTYQYKNPPTFPAGTVLRVVAYHDNSAANKLNPDPTAVVTWGERTVDEMNIGWIDYYYLTDAKSN